MLLHDFLIHAEATAARRPAVVDGAARRSYGEVTDRVRRGAAVLAGLGLAPGGRVAILAPNTSGFLEAYFAIALAGLIATPINIRLAASEVADQLDDCGASAVLADRACAGLVSERLDRKVVWLNGEDAGSWGRRLAAAEPLEAPRGPQDPDATAHIFYTGGTTGRAKGVMLSHRNVVVSAANKIVLGGFARDDVWLHAAPMFHQADAWAVLSFTGLGATHVFMPTFAPTQALDLIEQNDVTGFQLVPTMIFMMLDDPTAAIRDLSSIRRILYGSAPMPVEMLKRAQAAFGDVFQHIYGLTEAAGTVAATPWPASAVEVGGPRMTSCGQPIMGVRLRIASEDGAALPVGIVGHIQVKGATVMQGYWGRNAETAAAFQDGWLDTGDLGHMDADGFVFIVDRAKDMIITGGENVYSAEVEDVLYGHPDVAEAAVIGLPDTKWGEAVTAVVKVRSGAALDQAALQDHCRARLAAYKCPKRVVFVHRLPKSGAGKILKHEIRSSFEGPTP